MVPWRWCGEIVSWQTNGLHFCDWSGSERLASTVYLQGSIRPLGDDDGDGGAGQSIGKERRKKR